MRFDSEGDEHERERDRETGKRGRPAKDKGPNGTLRADSALIYPVSLGMNEFHNEQVVRPSFPPLTTPRLCRPCCVPLSLISPSLCPSLCVYL